jgi:hypothetical protein
MTIERSVRERFAIRVLRSADCALRSADGELVGVSRHCQIAIKATRMANVINAKSNANRSSSGFVDRRDVTHAKTTTATNIKLRLAVYSGSNDSLLCLVSKQALGGRPPLCIEGTDEVTTSSNSLSVVRRKVVVSSVPGRPCPRSPGHRPKRDSLDVY